MRCVHVTDTFLPKIGGAEIAIDHLVRAMAGSGDECALVAQRPRGMNGEIAVPYLLARFRNPRSSAWAGWWIERQLNRLVKKFGRPDVLIAHHAFPPGYACVSWGRRYGVPTIIYPRGGDIYQSSRFRRKTSAWRKLVWALTNASAVVCASGAMETIVRDILDPSSDQRIERIPNGVEARSLQADASSSRFARDELLAEPFVLALGRSIRRKGFHLLIDAYASLAAPPWRLVIGGDGRELNALRLAARPLGNRVVFTGMVEGADKHWLLQNCRLLAAPSLEESFGNVVLEAMACGKPVLAAKSSGMAEIVADGVNGRLVDVEQPEQLARALSEMMSIGLAGQSQEAMRTASRLSWETIAAKYHSLALSLIADSNQAYRNPIDLKCSSIPGWTSSPQKGVVVKSTTKHSPSSF